MALDHLETTLKKQWRLGQSIVLCWAFDPNGIYIGDFGATLRHSDELVGPADFLRYARDELLDISGLRMGESLLTDIRFESWSVGQADARVVEVTDKHGLSQTAHNLGFTVVLGSQELGLGLRNR